MFRENDCRAVDFVFGVILIIFSIIVLLMVLVLLIDKSSNLNDVSYVNAIATAFISVFTLCTVFISFQLKRINEVQAATQINQAFNEINHLILTNKKVRKVAQKYYELEVSSTGCCLSRIKQFISNCIFDYEELERTFIFSALNIYEAYYLNNKNLFTIRNLPLILNNMLKHENGIAKKIIKNHEFHEDFKKVCGVA